jgi:hypothetical protein
MQILAKIFFAGATILSSAAMAESLDGPAYIGDRSGNPEQESFGYLTQSESARPLAFIGPARNIGLVTGDAERDTIAYRPLAGMLAEGRWSFWLEQE